MATGDIPRDLPTEPVPPVDLGPIGPKQRYEFTKDQEEIVGDLAGKMGFVGAFLLALAVLGAVQVVIVAIRAPAEFKGLNRVDWFTAVNSLIYGLVGAWTMRASGAFAAVVLTTGWDVEHVMIGLGSLRKMYSLLYWMLMAALLAIAILLISSSVR